MCVCVCLHFQLNDAFTLYKKEKAENDRMLNETNDKLQKQLTELRSSHAKLTSQLEFSNKRFVRSNAAAAPASFHFGDIILMQCVFSVYTRYEMLQETVSAYRREIAALQDRSQKMAATAQKYEHIIHTMSQDLRQANEKLALEEVRKKKSLIIVSNVILYVLSCRYWFYCSKQKFQIPPTPPIVVFSAFLSNSPFFNHVPFVVIFALFCSTLFCFDVF